MGRKKGKKKIVEDEFKKQVTRRDFLKKIANWSGIVGSIFGGAVISSGPFISGCYNDYYSCYYCYSCFFSSTKREGKGPAGKKRSKKGKGSQKMKFRPEGGVYCNYFDYADTAK